MLIKIIEPQSWVIETDGSEGFYFNTLRAGLKIKSPQVNGVGTFPMSNAKYDTKNKEAYYARVRYEPEGDITFDYFSTDSLHSGEITFTTKTDRFCEGTFHFIGNFEYEPELDSVVSVINGEFRLIVAHDSGWW